MATVVRVPELGAAIANVAVLRWTLGEGDEVKQGETLLEVETDKMDMEIPAERGGVLLRIFARAGAETQEGAPLAIIGEAGEDVTALAAQVMAELGAGAEPATRTDTGEAAAQPIPEPAVIGPPGKVVATPAARRVAKELGIDLSHVLASGTRGSVSEEDVKRYQAEHGSPGAASAAAATPPAGDLEVIPLVGARKVLAERMAESFRVAPHYTIVVEIDCERLVALRDSLAEAFKRETGARLTYLPFVGKSVARAVQDVPIVNATVVGDEIHVSKTAHIGVAVAVDHLIVVPVIRSPVAKTIFEIGRELARLTELARARKLAPHDVAGGTITISNVGGTEIASGTSIINQPEVAMIAVTKIVDRVAVVDRAIVVRPQMNGLFTFDHRVVQGVPGARFAERVKAYLESPDELNA